jgi:pentatricopeptide repeat protein
MLARGLQPKIETMNKMVQLYAMGARLNRALECKNEFSKYGLSPDVKTYNTLILVRIFPLLYLLMLLLIEAGP